MKLPSHIRNIGNIFRIFLISSLIVLITATFGVTKPTYAGATLSNMSDVLSTNTQAATSVVHTITFTVTTGVGTTIAISTSSAWGTTPAAVTGDYTETTNGVSKTITSVTGTSNNRIYLECIRRFCRIKRTGSCCYSTSSSRNTEPGISGIIYRNNNNRGW